MPEDVGGAVLGLDMEPAFSVFGRRFFDVACTHSTARAARPRREQHAKGTAAQGRARVVRERTVGELFMENWRADKGWVFSGCKELAFCKTLASAGKGCAGPELVQWQELLSTRVRLGLPQVRRFVVAVVEHR